MAQLSTKLRSVGFGMGGHTGIGFWCPGCEDMHAICTNAGPGSSRPVFGNGTAMSMRRRSRPAYSCFG